MDNIVEQMVRDFPTLKKLNIQYIDSTNKPYDFSGNDVSGRKLEFYHPDEKYSPRKGLPTIEQFDKGMTKTDAFGEIFSHLLPRIDNKFKAARQTFIDSITPDQKKNMLEPDYVDSIKSGVWGSNAPSFDEWIQKQGGDAFFRGYPTGQYPADAYNPQQKILLDSLVNSLKNPQ